MPICSESSIKIVYVIWLTSKYKKSTQLNIGNLNGDQFEEALFNRLVSKCETAIQLKTTGLNNKNSGVVKLQFDDYAVIKTSSGLSLGSGCVKVLSHGFNRYPIRFHARTYVHTGIC